MKHRMLEIPPSLPLLLFATAAFVGCGGSDDDGSSAAGAAGSAGGSSEVAVPPGPPEEGVPGDGEGAVFGFTKIFPGDFTREGVEDPNAWKQFGYDLDGIKSTLQTTQHCQPVGDASPAAVKTDGDGGIDNSFGANLLPIFYGFAPDFSVVLNDNIDEGKYGFLLQIEKLGAGANYVGLPSSMYFGTKLGHPPVWDGSDAWPLYCELMEDCQETGTKQLEDGNESLVHFPWSYVVDHTWVSGAKATASISLTIQGIPVRLDIGQAVMSVELDPNDPLSGGANGVIAGILDTTHLVGTLALFAGRISTSLCDGETLEALKRNILAASDIMVDGTQDPNVLCDGISVGMGFEMKRAQLGPVQDAEDLREDQCGEEQ